MNLKQKIFYAIGGFLIGNSLLILLFWGLQAAPNKKTSQIKLDEAIQKLENKEIKEVHFRGSYSRFVDKEGNDFETTLGSEPTRENVLNKIKEYNKSRSSSSIKYSEEPASSGWGWLVLINALPFAFILCSIFAVIAAFFIGKRSSKLN